MKNLFKFSYKSLRKTVEYLQIKRQAKEREMLWIMQHLPFNEAVNELNRIFRENKQLKLKRYKAFRAWYKSEIDFFLSRPEDFPLTLDDGPYDKNNDPYYHPNAPDWALYDLDRSEDDFSEDDEWDDESDDECDLEDDNDIFGIENKTKKRMTDALYFGIGMGIADGLFGSPDFGGDSGGDG